VKDFILTSPYQKISPIVLLGSKKDMFGGIHIKLNSNKSMQESMGTIASLASKYNPEYPFEYQFVDQEYAQKFANLKSDLTISSLFGFTTIFIACLGLLGLSTFMIETRTKEIGIRKVLGSSVGRIVQLLGVESLKPIALAIVLFSPLAWWAMDSWLESFDYRIVLDIWVFVLAGVSILAITIVTIGLQTFGAARQNPVKSLRSE
jgi:ABC-type antimicrobial peptide transport system permease subunit